MVKEYYCYTCNRVFTYAGGVQSHNLDVHNDMIVEGVTKTCPLCGTLLRDQATLDVHRAEKHKPGWEPHLSEAAKKAAEKEKRKKDREEAKKAEKKANKK